MFSSCIGNCGSEVLIPKGEMLLSQRTFMVLLNWKLNITLAYSIFGFSCHPETAGREETPDFLTISPARATYLSHVVPSLYLYLLYQLPVARGLESNGHSPQEWLWSGSPPPNFSRQIYSLLVPISKTVNEEWEHFFYSDILLALICSHIHCFFENHIEEQVNVNTEEKLWTWVLFTYTLAQ